MPLTDAKCRSEQPGEKLHKLSDAGGLQLWVQPSGTKLWRFAYRFEGKQKLLAFGVYPSVSLAKARQARDNARRLLAEGFDPSAKRKMSASAEANAPTFGALADEYVAKLTRLSQLKHGFGNFAWFCGRSLQERCGLRGGDWRNAAAVPT